MPSMNRKRTKRKDKKGRNVEQPSKEQLYNLRAIFNASRPLYLQTEAAIRHRLLRGLTNWQLSQWNKAGCPQDLQRVRTCALLQRRPQS